MNWQERMEAALEYLERNLEGELEWGRAAAAANCSAFHFMRMFEVVAGVTIGEYVRRRRLSLAAQRLPSGEDRIVDLALRFGYESADAFSKAFRREFGMNPSEARADGARLRLWPRLSFSVVLKGDVPMEFRIENRESTVLVGLPLRVGCEGGENLRAIPAFWSRLNADGTVERLESAMDAESKLGVMGVCAGDLDEETKTFTYLAAIERPSGEDARRRLPEGCVELTAPAGTWVIFSARGALPDAIQSVWQRIYAEWFPSSGYEHAPGPDLEVYSRGDMGAADYYSEVWMPIRKVS